MLKLFIFFLYLFLHTFSLQAQETTPQDVPSPYLTEKEKEKLQKTELINKEREKPSSRFKQKAFKRAELREKRQQEIRDRQISTASRFQKQAISEEEQSIEEQKKEKVSENNNKSRFTRKAEERAKKRALKEEAKLTRKNRKRK
ncbi:MAG: hypothetical protein E7012_05180 [Alphaproteobacteria bacterium]|nr:hypothetical protein [Alphaproteobacteria bacterium]